MEERVTLALMSRHDRILWGARRLLYEADTTALNEIDGDFYWRLCRGDALDRMVLLRRQAESENLSEDMATKFIMSHMGDPQETKGLYEWGNARFFGLPKYVWHAFLRDKKISMRPPTELLLFNGGRAFLLRIFSPSFRGRDVEWVLNDLVPQQKREPGDPVSIYCRFAFSSTDPFSKLLRGTHESVIPPNIEVRATLPIPPGFLGREYDAIVREERQWHLQLVGTETPHDKQVAIRTWAIALLMREGASFQRALRALEPVFGYIELSQEADRQARNRLFERVPEARDCLGTR